MSDMDDEEYYEIDHIFYKQDEPPLHRCTLVFSKRTRILDSGIHFLVAHRLKFFPSKEGMEDLGEWLTFQSGGKKIHRMEIAETYIDGEGRTMAILKTFWLRIVQRTWKRVFREQRRCRMERCKLSSIKYKELHGHWPNGCRNYHELRGCLRGLLPHVD